MLDLINVSYDTQIPNNVGLSQDRKVLKALEKWHPGYLDWWNRLIPKISKNPWCICALRVRRSQRVGKV